MSDNREGKQSSQYVCLRLEVNEAWYNCCKKDPNFSNLFLKDKILDHLHMLNLARGCGKFVYCL